MPFNYTITALLALLLGGCDSEEDDSDSTDVDAAGDGWTIAAGDCDDGNPAAHPGATDGVADGVDQDCDGGEVCYVDTDGDGYGSTETVTSADLDCADAGEAPVDTDCDDGDLDVHPGADEYCNGQDDDCDGHVDEDAVDAVIRFPDADGDGYGDPDRRLLACEHSASYIDDDTDCDDFDRDVHPGTDEVCNDYDDDCDGHVDEEGAVGCATFSEDEDGDGYGTDVSACLCEPESPYTATESGECDDSDPEVHPGAEEVCDDGIDNDCDGAPGPDCGLTGEIDLSEVDAKLVGEDAGDHAGWSLAAGDIDGDGVEDVLVGAPYEGTGGEMAGAAYLVLGPVSGEVDLSAADAKFVGEDEDDEAGWSLATGDVNGDGVDDVLVGAYGEDSGGIYAGAAYLVLGPASGTVDLSEADATLVGEEICDYAGYSLAAGDVNGDGVDDILVGAYGSTTDPWWQSGAAYLVLGPVAGRVSLSRAEAKLTGERSPDWAGSAVASGDVDGDGIGDILVGAPMHNHLSGAVYLVHGPVRGAMSLSEADAKLTGHGNAGESVAAGDVDGDGLDDVLVGAPYERTGGDDAGAVYLVLGPVSGEVDLSAADAKLVGEEAEDHVGCSVATGDVNGDGTEDVLVGAVGQDAGGEDAGAVYLVLGPISGTVDLSVADTKFVGENTGDYAGRSLAAGDVDGRGSDDILVGAYREDTGGEGAGAAYLLLGGGL